MLQQAMLLQLFLRVVNDYFAFFMSYHVNDNQF